MESVPHLKPLESYSEVKSSTDLLRNPGLEVIIHSATSSNRSLSVTLSTTATPTARARTGRWIAASNLRESAVTCYNVMCGCAGM